MKTRSGQKIKMATLEELLGVPGEESASEVEIRLIHSFKDHPFKVINDEKMEELVESIRRNGVLSPVILRPAEKNTYEMISGHRRMHAAKLAGFSSIPAFIRDMTDDESTIFMVDSNIQREELLPSEKAFAYKMKMDAMRRQGARTDLRTLPTSNQNDWKLESADLVSEETGESKTQIRRYIRLTSLVPELLDYVDQKRIQFVVGVEISYIDQKVQKWLFEYIKDNGHVKLNQIPLLRKHLQTGAITQPKMIALLNDSQPGKTPSSKLTFTEKKLRDYFPAEYTTSEMRAVIEDLLMEWKRSQTYVSTDDEEV